MFILGNPAVLLVLAGAVNGLILPITLAICLIAAHKKSIMGENYHHPVVLTILGVIVVILTAYLGVTTVVSKIGTLLELRKMYPVFRLESMSKRCDRPGYTFLVH